MASIAEFGIRKNNVVPKAQYPVTVSLQKLRTRPVFLNPLRMLSTIHFHDKLSRRAGEVRDVWSCRNLPRK